MYLHANVFRICITGFTKVWGSERDIFGHKESTKMSPFS